MCEGHRLWMALGLLLALATLGAAAHAQSARSLDVAALVTALRARLASTCVFVIVRAERTVSPARAVRLQRGLPFPSAALPTPPPHVNCTGASLYVRLDGQVFTEELHAAFARAAPHSAWLVFSRAGATAVGAEALLRGRDAPCDSLLLAARRAWRPGGAALLEVWRAAPDAAVRRGRVARWRGGDGDGGEGRLEWTPLGLARRRADLAGAALRVVARRAVPVLEIREENGTVILDSMVGKFWNELQRILNFRAEIEIDTSNLTTDDHVLLMRDPRNHVALAEISMTRKRHQFADFTMAFFAGKAHFFLRHLGHNTPRWRGFLEPFATSLWLTLVGTMLLTAVGLHIVCSLRPRDPSPSRTSPQGSPPRFTDSLLCAAGTFCMQGCEPPLVCGAARALQVGAYLTAVSVFAAYSGQVVSRLAVRRVAMPFKNIEQFAADTTYTLTLVNGTSEYEILTTSRDPMMRQLARGKSVHNVSTESSIESGIQAMCSQRTALFASYTLVVSSLSDACGVIMMPDFSVASGMALALPKGSPYRRFFDRVITILREHGVTKKFLWEAHFQELPPQVIPLKGVGFPEIIPMLALIGLVCLICLLILIIEWWVYYMKNKTFKMKKHPT